jgi:hypothetical protein
MEALAVSHHLEKEPTRDPSHYETVDELCIGHSGFPSLLCLNVVTQGSVWVADST